MDRSGRYEFFWYSGFRPTYGSERVRYSIRLRFEEESKNPISVVKSYYSNTGKNLWGMIRKHLQETFPGHEFELDHDDDRGEFIYFYEPKDDPELLDTIMKSLIEFYKRKALQSNVPKLITLLCNNLKNRETFAKALMGHQRKHGYNKAEQAVYTFFRDIYPNER